MKVSYKTNTPFFIVTMLLFLPFSSIAQVSVLPVGGEIRPVDPPIVVPVTPIIPGLRPADSCSLERARATTALADGASDPGEVVDRFIRRCPRVLDALIFEPDYGDPIAYPSWSYAQSARLKDIFASLVRGEADLELACPDILANMAFPSQTTANSVYYTAEQAFDVFAAHAAHVLFLELTDRVPWSILSFNDGEIEELLAFDRYFAPIKPSLSEASGQYPDHIRPGRDFQLPFRVNNAQEAVICDPREAYRFIRGQVSAHLPDLLGQDPEETLVHLTAWMRDNVQHGDDEAFHDRTEVAGYAFLADRLKIHPRVDTIMALAGCHSAAALLYDLAKGVNIPLLMVRSQDREDTSGHYGSRTHSGLVFRWESEAPRILRHSDDIYANRLGPAFPLGNTGFPLSEEEADQRYFDELWVAPDVLSEWHFERFDGFPMIYPDEGFGAHSRGAYEDFYEYSEFVGYWPEAIDGEPLFARERYEWEGQYHLCGRLLLTTYCHFEEAPWNFIYSLDAILGPTGAYPLHRNGNDFLERAGDCVQANGGCEAISARIEAWSAARGAHTWPR